MSTSSCWSIRRETWEVKEEIEVEEVRRMPSHSETRLAWVRKEEVSAVRDVEEEFIISSSDFDL